jgi:hypothetical protein
LILRVSGHTDYSSIDEQFDALLNGFDLVSKGKFHLRFGFPGELIEAYRRTGRPDWLHIYELGPADLIKRVMEDLFHALGISQEERLKGVPGHEQPLFKRLLELYQTEPDPSVLLGMFANRFLPIVLDIRCLITMTVAQFQFRQPMESIISSAKNGDRASSLKLVKLDHLYLYSDILKTSVAEAELANNQVYFKSLTKALMPDPKFWSLRGQRKYIALFLLYHSDEFAYARDNEWAEFLTAHGFPDYADAENVRRARGRYGLKKLQKT